MCGLAVPFAFAPHGFAFVELVSLTMMLLMVKLHSQRFACLLWFVFGLGMFGYGVWWIQVSVHQFGLPMYSFSVTVTAALIIIQAAHIALFGMLCQRLWRSDLSVAKLCGIPAAWVLVEFLRTWFASGFPWLLMGYAHTETLFGNFAPVGSAYLVSYFVVLTAAILAMTISDRHIKFVVVGLLVTGVAYALSFVSWQDARDTADLRATLVQGAVPQEIKWHPEVRQPSIDLYRQLSEPHWQSDIIIWPETAIPAYADEVPKVLSSLKMRVADESAALLVGLAIRDATNNKGVPRRYFNSLVKIGGSESVDAQSITARYDKRHLVPFGEYMPFDAILRPITDMLSVPMSDFSKGETANVSITAGDMILGTSICYEDAYAELIRDALPAANVLVNISNDAWFGATIAPHQHLQISQMRALELGRYMLRATNTGISAVINERGKLVARSAQFKPEALSAEFKLLHGLTPFARFGTLPILLWCLVSLLIAYALRHKARK